MVKCQEALNMVFPLPPPPQFVVSALQIEMLSPLPVTICHHTYLHTCYKV